MPVTPAPAQPANEAMLKVLNPPLESEDAITRAPAWRWVNIEMEARAIWLATSVPRERVPQQYIFQHVEAQRPRCWISCSGKRASAMADLRSHYGPSLEPTARTYGMTLTLHYGPGLEDAMHTSRIYVELSLL